MKRLLGGSDIKENCQIESCFDFDSKVSRIGKAPGCEVVAQWQCNGFGDVILVRFQATSP